MIKKIKIVQRMKQAYRWFFGLCTLGFLFLEFGCTRHVPVVIPAEQLVIRSPERERKASEILALAQDYEKAGNDSKALDVYQSIWKQFAETESAPSAYHRAGRLYAKKRQYNRAFESFKVIGEHYPQYPQFSEVVKDQFDVAYTLMQGRRPYYLGLIPGFKDYDSAIQFFDGVVKSAPFSEQAPKALFCIARLENEHGAKAKAIDALDRLMDGYSDFELIPEAYLFQAEIYLSLVHGPEYDQGATQKALHCYEDFLTLFGSKLESGLINSAQLQRAQQGLRKAKMLYAQSRLVVGDFFYLRRHYGAGALTFYDEARMAAPETPIADLASKKMDQIQKGVQAPRTWADHCFGLYRHVAPVSDVEDKSN